jgi:Zn ribbon nucleic-acid-binding protein
MDCPICGSVIANARGLASHFRHQSASHPDYSEWIADRRWDKKIEGADYVRCQECGIRSVSLTKHIQIHGLNADEYRARHGADAKLRSDSSNAKIRAGVAAAHASGRMGHDDTKDVVCTGCGCTHAVSKFVVPGTHDLRCSVCRSADADSRWYGKVEGLDFVVCRECGHRAENLTSHVQNAHPKLVGRYHLVYGASPMVAFGSAIRNKISLRGRVLSDDIRNKMSANAGRWNAGLTKHSDKRVELSAGKMRGSVPWNLGLTSGTDARLQSTAAKVREWMLAHPEHGAKHAAALTRDDFEPYLDAQGRVDRRAAEGGIAYSWQTLLTYMGKLGLATSDVHAKNRAEASTIRIDRDDLLRFTLGNGKVSIGAAMSGLGVSFSVIRRECARHGLETFHRRIRQTLCLGAVSKALGDAPYVQEWTSWSFTNHRTGHRFRFDGYYASVNLIVEFHGHQHYTFPNAFMLDESYRKTWEDLCWRDAEKERMAAEAGIRYLVVREDEPFTDASYMARRLYEIGRG